MIEDYKYGCFWVDGKEYLGDLMIKNNKPRYWQDLETRELKVDHISNLLSEEPEVFVIGTGAGGLLKVGEHVMDYFNRWKMSNNRRTFIYVEKNTEAIKIINDAMKNGKKVCALLAGGC
jgi:hypothetical protein